MLRRTTRNIASSGREAQDHWTSQANFTSRSLEPVSRLEVQNVGDRDTIEMTADSPGGKKSSVDELVHGFPVELPAVT